MPNFCAPNQWSVNPLSVLFILLILNINIISTIRVLQEPGHNALEEEEEEEEEDPIFVLTDEWREFFAKSEAKRKLG